MASPPFDPEAPDLDATEAEGFSTPLIDDDDEAVQDLQAAFAAALSQAEGFVIDDLQDQRVQALQYYNGEMPDLPAPHGRSQYKTTDVRDTVNAQMPALLRIFFGNDAAVEFKPGETNDEESAKQATDYINRIVIREDNPGFLLFHGWFKDALITSMGIMKWWWEPLVKHHREVMENLPAEAIQLLLHEIQMSGAEANVKMLQQHQDGTVTVEVTETERYGRSRFRLVRPEEFLYIPNMATLDDPGFLAHDTIMTASELAAMGFDVDDLATEYSIGPNAEHRATDEQDARQRDQTSWNLSTASDRNRALRTYRVVEAYMTWQPPYEPDDPNRGPDEPAGLYKIIACGSSPKVIAYERVESAPFAILVPDPMPHTLTGLGTADLTVPIQRLTTAVTRGMLDSLAMSLNPETEAVEGQVEMKDLMETEVGRNIRVLQPGMINRVQYDFVGRECLGVLQYAKEMREEATGTTRAAAGLDADVLQSTTKAAVVATLSGSAQRTEMISRIFAETGVKRLFSGLLKQEVSHQNKPRTLKLRGKYVPVDPRSWDAGMDVRVNVGLGTGGKEEKIAGLSQIAQKQEQVLQLLGPQNPLVTVSQYRNTLARIVEQLGFVNGDEFFKEIDEEALAAQAQAEAQKPKDPSPEEVLAQAQMQIERMKAEANIAIERAKLALEQHKLKLEDDRERDKNEMNAYVAMAKIEADTGMKMNTDNLTEIIERDRESTKLRLAEIDAEARREAAQTAADAAIDAVRLKAKAQEKVAQQKLITTGA